mgnify:CR=1 FL=1
MKEKLSKINQLYNLYAEDPQLTNEDAIQALNAPSSLIRNMKYRLKTGGYIDVKDDGTVEILKPFRETRENAACSLKSDVYSEMIDTYLEDFRAQTTFADRLAVGREIRLLLDKM